MVRPIGRSSGSSTPSQARRRRRITQKAWTRSPSPIRNPGCRPDFSGNGGLPEDPNHHWDASAEITCTARRSRPGQMAGAAEVFFLSDDRDGRTAAPFAAAFRICCSPWFGTRQTTRPRPHGALSSARESGSSTDRPGSNSVVVSMSIENEEAARRWWPGDFRFTYRVTFGAALA